MPWLGKYSPVSCMRRAPAKCHEAIHSRNVRFSQGINEVGKKRKEK